jgi:natural product precursor
MKTMNRKVAGKRLTLKKHTIAALNGTELVHVRGGGWSNEGNCTGGCTETDYCCDPTDLIDDVVSWWVGCRQE